MVQCTGMQVTPDSISGPGPVDRGCMFVWLVQGKVERESQCSEEDTEDPLAWEVELETYWEALLRGSMHKSGSQPDNTQKRHLKAIVTRPVPHSSSGEPELLHGPAPLQLP